MENQKRRKQMTEIPHRRIYSLFFSEAVFVDKLFVGVLGNWRHSRWRPDWFRPQGILGRRRAKSAPKRPDLDQWLRIESGSRRFILGIGRRLYC